MSSQERVPLIVYAVPVGALDAQLADYRHRTTGLGANAAAGYPPHCTVTGFFRRRRADIPAVVAALDQALATVRRNGAVAALEDAPVPAAPAR